MEWERKRYEEESKKDGERQSVGDQGEEETCVLLRKRQERRTAKRGVAVKQLIR